jgi:hypothetical protein
MHLQGWSGIDPSPNGETIRNGLGEVGHEAMQLSLGVSIGGGC